MFADGFVSANGQRSARQNPVGTNEKLLIRLENIVICLSRVKGGGGGRMSIEGEDVDVEEVEALDCDCGGMLGVETAGLVSDESAN